MSKFTTGSRVRLTAKFLRNTGQYTGGEPMSKWTVQPCACSLCATGKFVATDERNCDDTGQRHIAAGNLQATK